MNKANLLSKSEMKKVKGGHTYPPSYCLDKPDCKGCCPLTSDLFICEVLCDSPKTT